MTDLGTYLGRLTPAASERWTWPTSGLTFDVKTYLTTLDPPLELVVSVRAIAMRAGDVFVFESDGRTYAIPGGRREPGESPDGALVREIMEETGCEISGQPRRLGILHLYCLSPQRRDPKYTYPYPDTLQWVFAAEVVGEATPSDDPFVLNGRFVSGATARELVTSPGERVFLDAALASR